MRLPNKPLQLTEGNCGFMDVVGVVAGLGLSDGFRQPPAATELLSLDACLSMKEIFTCNLDK